MDWDSYKRLADTPGVWSRWMLEQTIELLQQPQLGAPLSSSLAKLQVCLAQQPIPKPADHKGGASLDMFELHLDLDEAEALLGVVRRAVDLGLTTSGTGKRGLGGFVEAWQEYRASLDAP